MRPLYPLLTGKARGWELRKKGKKHKIIVGTQPKARARWLKRLRLVQATA